MLESEINIINIRDFLDLEDFSTTMVYDQSINTSCYNPNVCYV